MEVKISETLGNDLEEKVRLAKYAKGGNVKTEGTGGQRIETYYDEGENPRQEYGGRTKEVNGQKIKTYSVPEGHSQRQESNRQLREKQRATPKEESESKEYYKEEPPKPKSTFAKVVGHFKKRDPEEYQSDQRAETKKKIDKEYEEDVEYAENPPKYPSKFRENVTKAGKIIAPKLKSGAIKTGSLLKKAGKASAPLLRSAGKAVAGGINRVGKNMERGEEEEEESRPRRRRSRERDDEYEGRSSRRQRREPEDDELMFTPFRGHREEESRPRRNVAPPDTDFFGLTQRSGRSIKEEYTARPFSMSRPDSSSPFTFGSRQVSPQPSRKIISMGTMPISTPRGNPQAPSKKVKTKFIKKTTIKSGNQPKSSNKQNQPAPNIKKNQPKSKNKQQQNSQRQVPRQTREPPRRRRMGNDDDMIWGI